nr:MAG TPA: hypothetical protein [Caudoviricetes sp.]
MYKSLRYHKYLMRDRTRLQNVLSRSLINPSNAPVKLSGA